MNFDHSCIIVWLEFNIRSHKNDHLASYTCVCGSTKLRWTKKNVSSNRIGSN